MKTTLQLQQRHEVSDSDRQIFRMTPLQKLFIEEYLSNGLQSTDAARQALTALKPELANKDRRYYSYRATSFLESTPVSTYLAKNLNKPKSLTSIDDVLKVVSSIMNEESNEPKDRLKAAELLLKHMGGFARDNAQKAPKSIVLNQITEMSDKELEQQLRDRLASPSQKIKDNNIIDVEEIED
jgi:cysteinyl-tRNA synthetase